MSHDGVSHIGGRGPGRDNLADPQRANLDMSEPAYPNQNCDGSNAPHAPKDSIAREPPLQSQGCVDSYASWCTRNVR